MSGVHVEEVDGCLIVSGQTYPIKDALKRLGFRWKGKEKYWKHPAASHLLRVQVAQVLGKSSLEPAHPSNIHFHAQQDEEEDYSPNGVGGQLINVHLEEDDYRPEPARQLPPQRPRAPPQRPKVQRPRDDYYYSPEARRAPPSIEELYVDQRPAVRLEVFCPSDDDEVFQ